MRSVSWIAVIAIASCNQPAGDELAIEASVNTDPTPSLTFSQVGRTVGILRSNEPASAGTFSANGTLAYGGWLADLDGDGKLDYFGVNHGQLPHLSGLFMNNGAGGFGKNLFTVSFQPSPVSFPNLDLSNEVRFVGDLTGDGKVDLYFISWSGLGVLCVNQGVATRGDWTGPGYSCAGTSDGLAFADVNGDGRPDVLQFDLTNFDSYTAYYSQTATYQWRLNNGTPNITSWPITRDLLSLRVNDPTQVAAPFVDLNGDHIPDKIVGIPLPAGQRGQNATNVGGQQVFLGQANGTYVQRTSTGLDNVAQPITRLEDVNDDGCIDVGVDTTGYRDNQSWFIQNKTGGVCNVTFTATARTALPYYPGFKRYSVDLDNSGLLSKAVIIHKAYGTNDGRAGGVTIFRKLPDGSYTAISPTQSGININGTSTTEFYADNLTPGDWNDDGLPDLAGSGNASIANSDSGFALWTSALATTNNWIKVTLPTVTGFFAGSATLEVFDAGFAGDPAHVVTPARVLYPGNAWASQVYHLGIGTRSSVDVRVTFPDGRVTTRTVAAKSRTAIDPTVTPPPPDTTAPVVAITGSVFTPTVSDNIGVVKVEWYFDGALSATATAAPFSYTLNLSPAAGSHVLTAKAFDAAGNARTSAPVTIAN